MLGGAEALHAYTHSPPHIFSHSHTLTLMNSYTFTPVLTFTHKHTSTQTHFYRHALTYCLTYSSTLKLTPMAVSLEVFIQ